LTREERYRHINEFYGSIYGGNPGIALEENCIENFLGPDVCNNNIVKSSKLSEADRQVFDNELSINELDNAAMGLNANSAGGMDGIGGKFIKKYWIYFRKSLHRYANYCVGTGTLTQSFNSAGIRLIPKKGDTTMIKNWRPISLLNCVYKVIAKALDNRLKKISEKILSRAQKGFTSKRQLHECIINSVETIAYAEKHKIPGFILGLDMAKAFDTVRHECMTHVYRFFGFGPWLINALNTISTGRTASILLKDGSLSEAFRLGSGFPQGSPPSPNQFNFVEQLLIFKLELDPRIKKIKELNPLMGGSLEIRYRVASVDLCPT
jgi:hypothetical protein